jgi:DNA-binding IclR family transcriptional regulator
VDLTRRRGFNIDRRNYIAGLTIVAVPVLDSRGAITHAVGAVGISSQLGRARALALARDMRAAAGALAAQMVAHA